MTYPLLHTVPYHLPESSPGTQAPSLRPERTFAFEEFQAVAQQQHQTGGNGVILLRRHDTTPIHGALKERDTFAHTAKRVSMTEIEAGLLQNSYGPVLGPEIKNLTTWFNELTGHEEFWISVGPETRFPPDAEMKVPVLAVAWQLAGETDPSALMQDGDKAYFPPGMIVPTIRGGEKGVVISVTPADIYDRVPVAPS